MIVVDAEYNIIYMNCGHIGRISDGGVFRDTTLFADLEQDQLNLPPSSHLPGRNKLMPFVLVADDAFALSKYLMKPYPHKSQHIDKRVFNYRLSRARRMVESVFGILASKFRILRKPIELAPKKTELIVSTICVLHNFLLTTNTASHYAGEFAVNEGEMAEELPTENLIALERGNANNSATSASSIRDEFKDFFVSPAGEVPWQYKYVLN